jgi:[acyl-carrier-protein] S-malonyltransferase
MNGFVALFPGQLSEKAGMGEALAGTYPYVGDFFDEVSRRSGVDLAATFFGIGSPLLHDDLPAQVGVFAVSVAVLDVLERQHGLWPAAAAGYSLGTYAALVAAGSLDRWGALEVILEVERLLHDLKPGGGMGFVIGLPAVEVEWELRSVAPEAELAIGNRNAPNQVVVSGRNAPLNAALAALAPRALKAGRLPVGWPMHSALLRPVVERVGALVRERILVAAPSRARLFAPMLSREVTTAAEATGVLVNQVAHPSDWDGTMRAVASAGYTDFVEAGPGDVLSRMLRWTVREARPMVLESPETIGRFAAGRVGT